MKPEKWDVWLVRMPYEDTSGEKIRPALVIHNRGIVITVGKMTSHEPRQNYPYEYALIDWQGAGLTRQTTLRLSKTVSLENTKFLKKIGVLQPTDQVNVRAILDEILRRMH